MLTKKNPGHPSFKMMKQERIKAKLPAWPHLQLYSSKEEDCGILSTGQTNQNLGETLSLACDRDRSDVVTAASPR